ncbi:MAG: hypothetical protein ACT4O1_06700 [Gemmatimonadota bacterium]
MRKLALPLILLLACGDDDAPRVQLLDGIPAKARLACSIADISISGLAVRELGSGADGRLLALLDDDRRVVLLDDQLNTRWSFRFDKEGPKGVAIPTSAVLIDSTLYVVDRQLPRIRRFTVGGTVLSDVELDFVPLRLVNVADRLAIIPAVLGRYPPWLLYVLEGDTAVPQPIQPFDDANVSIKMLGNMMSTAVLNDQLLLVHQYLTPRAYLWRQGSQPRPVTVSLPREFRRSIGYLPPVPLDEAALEPVLAIALAAAADPISNEFLVLMRSGRKLNQHYEKALFRTDAQFNYIDAARLPMNAGHLAVISSRDLAVLIDEEGGWYTCPLR